MNLSRSFTLLYIDPAITAYIIQIVAGAAISLGVLFQTKVVMNLRQLKIRLIGFFIVRRHSMKKIRLRPM